MTEKEKCRAGLYYNANFDEQLVEERKNCKILCEEYNHTKYADFDKKNKLIRRIVNSVKDNFFIEQPFWCDYGYNLTIGENFYSNHNLVILDCANVTIGDNVFIGPNCGIYTAGHPTDVTQRIEGLEYAHPIVIGDNVWLGGNVVILPGITIGANTIIGAGSVVTKDIPANTVAVGNPCKVVKDISGQ